MKTNQEGLPTLPWKVGLPLSAFEWIIGLIGFHTELGWLTVVAIATWVYTIISNEDGPFF